MGVQLNIKDAETVRLARELAGRAGKGVTETIREALEMTARTQSAEREERRRRIIATTKQIRSEMPAEAKAMSLKEIMDSIYVDGLPE